MVAVEELVDRLGVIERLDARIGPIKTRRPGVVRRAATGGGGRSSWSSRSWSGWTVNVGGSGTEFVAARP
jgi:hypothetical protein